MEDSLKVTVSCGTKFHSDQTAYQLSRHNLLDKVLTSHPAKYYLNRVPLEKGKVKFLLPVFLLVYGLQRLAGAAWGLTSWLNYRMPLVYDKLAARSVKGTGILLTWAWSGLATIKKVKAAGGLTIVEECGSCSAFQNEILSEEYKSLGLKFTNLTPQFIVTRQLQEAALADYLLCPSAHVAASFHKFGIPKEKCRIIPYGANIEMFKPVGGQKTGFKILFVGTVGVRKGLIYLFQAVEELKKKNTIECVVIGRLEEQFRPVFDKYAHLITHLSHVPHKELVSYYNQASVFVFPSLDEGMALVQLEALACGLPVICTPNSGGDSVIDNGEEGFIVPVRDSHSIAEKLLLMLNSPALVAEMSARARAKATAFSWDNYGDNLAAFIGAVKPQNGACA